MQPPCLARRVVAEPDDATDRHALRGPGGMDGGHRGPGVRPCGDEDRQHQVPPDDGLLDVQHLDAGAAEGLEDRPGDPGAVGPGDGDEQRFGGAVSGGFRTDRRPVTGRRCARRARRASR